MLTRSQYARLVPDFLAPEVKDVLEWFSGAVSKCFAKDARRLFDMAVDSPIDYVKEFLKVTGQSIGLRKPVSIFGLMMATSPMAVTFPSPRRVSIA